MLRKMSGPKRMKVNSQFKIQHNKELRNEQTLQVIQYFYDSEI
jgi:hypothetical protein